jgi:hypothetical protein
MNRVIIFALAVAGCSGTRDGPDAAFDAMSTTVRCDVSDTLSYAQPYCRNAMNLAIRYGTHVLITQAEVDRYYRLAATVYIAEPITRMAAATTVTDAYRVELTSTYGPIVNKWESGVLVTGDSLVDALFAEEGALSVSYPFPSLEPPSFIVVFPSPVNIYVVAQRLAAIPETQLLSNTERSFNDVTVIESGGETQLHMVAGWGDCPPGCAFFHTWDAYIHRGVDVIDRGGDPIPDWMVDAALSSTDP